MHPGEDHIRTAIIATITDNLPEMLGVGAVQFAIDIVDCTMPTRGICVGVMDASNKEIARYSVAVTATKIGVPKKEEPEWIENYWRNIWVGDITLGTDGNEWRVVNMTISVDGTLHVLVSYDDQEFTFTPALDQVVKYRRLESV